MIQAATTQPKKSLFEREFSPARLAFGATVMGVAGAIAAGLFTTISPLGGAIFGVSYFLGHRLIHWICDKIGCHRGSMIFNVARFALSAIGGIAAGVLLTTFIGFPMTMANGAFLTVTSVAVTVAALLVLGSCLCCSVVTTGIALGGNDGVSIRV
jgi:hypothetical protein